MRRMTKDEFSFLMEKTGRGKKSDFLFRDPVFDGFWRKDKHSISPDKAKILERKLRGGT